MGDRAIVILKILGVAPALQRELVGQQDEAGLSVEARANGRKAIGAHVRPCALDAVGEKPERRDVAKIGRVDPPREIDPSLERNRHRAPLAVEAEAYSASVLTTGTATQSTWTCNCSWLRAHFELIASPTASRGSGRPSRASTRVLGPPGVGKNGRRVGLQHLRVFDPGDPPGRNGEHLRDADEVLEDRHALGDAAVEIDPLAGLRSQTRFDMGHAFAMDDPPQGVRVGAGGARARQRERGNRKQPR